MVGETNGKIVIAYDRGGKEMSNKKRWDRWDILLCLGFVIWTIAGIYSVVNGDWSTALRSLGLITILVLVARMPREGGGVIRISLTYDQILLILITVVVFGLVFGIWNVVH